MRNDDPEAFVVAGLLQAAGGLPDDLTSPEATQRLVELLDDDSTLWRRADDGATLVGTEAVKSSSAAALWTAPDERMQPGLVAALRTAWSEAVARGPKEQHRILRVTLEDAKAAEELAELRDVGTVRLAPLIAKSASRFTWRWPLRVGVMDGPRASQWRDQINASRHAGRLFDVRVMKPGDDGDLDILLVDDDIAAGAERAQLRDTQATCVLVVGESRPVGALLERAAGQLDPAIAAGVVASDADWFRLFVHELSHDQPVDAALVLTAPESRVTGDPEFVSLTAVGRWAAAIAAEDARAAPHAVRHPIAPDLESIVTEGDFSLESLAASDISDVTRRFVGTSEERIIERGMEPAGVEAPAAELPTARRLLADITCDGQLCTKSLAPDRDHQLEVQIAIPERPDQGVVFPEGAVPTGDGVVRLDIVVRSTDLGLNARGQIDLPTADPSLASSVATFPFRTGPEGSLLAFEVLVFHQRRPIQEVRVLATVRATPARRDRIQVVPVPLSAPPEPMSGATPAELALDARDNRLTNFQTSYSIPVDSGAVRDLLDEIEQHASRVLALETETTWRAGEPAPQLLVELAQIGSDLYTKFADIDIKSARTVSMLVRFDTPIMPLELTYAAPAPTDGARLCSHATRPPAASHGPCSKASTKIVCPYAFWGMYRTIARTIESRPGRASVQRLMAPLSLRPVLYAAANRADNDLPNGTPKDAYPSQLLQSALRDAIGTEVARVTNWRKWRTQVLADRPQLLVVLAHTEIIKGDSALLIGRQSVLARRQVKRSLVTPEGSPAPLVVLLACESAVPGSLLFGALPASFTDSGAAAVVATLSKLKGPNGAQAAAAVVSALRDSGTSEGTSLGVALTAARRSLVQRGNLVGLVLVAHGEIDVKLIKE